MGKLTNCFAALALAFCACTGPNPAACSRGESLRLWETGNASARLGSECFDFTVAELSLAPGGAALLRPPAGLVSARPAVMSVEFDTISGAGVFGLGTSSEALSSEEGKRSASFPSGDVVIAAQAGLDGLVLQISAVTISGAQ